MTKTAQIKKTTTKPQAKRDDALVAIAGKPRASKAQRKSEDRRSGLAQGAHWAEKQADSRILDWLQCMGWYIDLDPAGPPEGTNYAWSLASDLVNLTMGGPEYYNHKAIYEMVGTLFPDPDRSYSEAFVLGFIEGAVKKYRKVADKI